MDPVEGRVLVDGVDLREVAFASLRERVVMVPQDGFLFDGYASWTTSASRGPTRPTSRCGSRSTELGLVDWARRAAARLAHRGRPARRVAVGGGAPAGRAGPGLPRRPRPAGARRGDLGGRPGDRGADPARARQADPRAARHHDRAPALDGRGRRRGAGHGRRAAGRARAAARCWPLPAAGTPSCTPAGPPSERAGDRTRT